MLPVNAGRTMIGNGKVRRVRGFEMDVRPVTNAEYARFIKETGHSRPPWIHRPGFGEPDQPVVGVTYEDASAFARWAGKRLPTESEWVRAARGDDQRTYPWGDTHPERAHAHFDQGPKGAPAPVDDAGARSAGTGPYGHVELIGNVWEWCQGATLRGGFWGARTLGIDIQLVEQPQAVYGGIGFRCVR